MNASTSPASTSPNRSQLLSSVARSIPRLYFADEFDNLPAVQWQIWELLPQDGIVIVYGQPGVGKSLFMKDLALHVAHGLDFFGRPTKQGLVIYVAAEGARGIVPRVNGWHIAKGLSRTGAPFAMWPAAVNLLDGDEVSAFIEQVRAAAAQRGDDVAMVVFDTLSRSIPGADENQQQAMSSLIQACDTVRMAFGCVVSLVHHATKNGEHGPRGSSVLKGAADTVIVVKEAKSGGVIVEVEKQKDGEAGGRFALGFETVDLGVASNGRRINTRVPVFLGESDRAPSAANDNQPLSKNLQAALDLVKEAGPAGAAKDALRAEFQSRGIGGKRSSAFAETMARLVDRGLVIECGDRYIATE